MNSNDKAEVFFIVIKRIFKWLFFIFLGVILIFFSFISYEKYIAYEASKPKLLTGFSGIELGQKLPDVLFKNKGFKNIPMEKDSSLGESSYENSESGTSFFVTDNLVVHINQYCKEKFDFLVLNNISCNSSGEEIVSKYGKDLLVQCLIDKTEKYYIEHRVYDISKYGVRYHLFSNKVAAMTVASPEKIKSYTGTNWKPCD